MIVYQHRRLDTNEIFYIGIGKTKQRAFNKYHRSKFWKGVTDKTDYSVEIVTTCETWSEACQIEQYLIKFYGRRDLGLGTLVNLTDGGDGTINTVVSDETKEKMSLAKKGNTHRIGETHSDETKAKMSKVKTGKKHTDETKAKMSLDRKGRKLSEETKAKMSKSKTGRKLSDETRAKMSESAKRRKLLL